MISYTQELALLLSALGTYWLARRLGRRSVGQMVRGKR